MAALRPAAVNLNLSSTNDQNLFTYKYDVDGGSAGALILTLLGIPDSKTTLLNFRSIPVKGSTQAGSVTHYSWKKTQAITRMLNERVRLTGLLGNKSVFGVSGTLLGYSTSPTGKGMQIALKDFSVTADCPEQKIAGKSLIVLDGVKSALVVMERDDAQFYQESELLCTITLPPKARDQQLYVDGIDRAIATQISYLLHIKKFAMDEDSPLVVTQTLAISNPYAWKINVADLMYTEKRERAESPQSSYDGAESAAPSLMATRAAPIVGLGSNTPLGVVSTHVASNIELDSSVSTSIQGKSNQYSVSVYALGKLRLPGSKGLSEEHSSHPRLVLASKSTSHVAVLNFSGQVNVTADVGQSMPALLYSGSYNRWIEREMFYMRLNKSELVRVGLTLVNKSAQQDSETRRVTIDYDVKYYSTVPGPLFVKTYVIGSSNEGALRKITIVDQKGGVAADVIDGYEPDGTKDFTYQYNIKTLRVAIMKAGGTMIVPVAAVRIRAEYELSATYE